MTVLSLAMGITVFVTLQNYLSHLSVAGAVSEHLGDYSVVNLYDGFLPDELARMEADVNVSAVAAQQFSFYKLDAQYKPVGIETDFSLGIGECFQIFGANEYYAAQRIREKLTEEQWNAWLAGEGCIVRNPITMTIEGLEIGTTHIEEGSTMTIAGHKLSVLMTLDGYDGYFSIGNNGFMNGVQVFVNDRLYPQLTGTDHYAELCPVLRAVPSGRRLMPHLTISARAPQGQRGCPMRIWTDSLQRAVCSFICLAGDLFCLSRSSAF